MTQFLNDECMAGYPVPEVQDSNIYWIHPDHFSGASILTDAQGYITNWYEYMPFGEMMMENTNLTYDNPYKYNAKEFDKATGYYYYGARYYDPRCSVWLSVDPLVDITNSPYAYVWNDPVNFADPSGLMGERVGGNNPCDPPAKRGFVRRTWDTILGWFKGKPHGKVTDVMPTSSREPDLPTFSQAPDYRRPNTTGGWLQSYRDYEPSPTDLGG